MDRYVKELAKHVTGDDLVNTSNKLKYILKLVGIDNSNINDTYLEIRDMLLGIIESIKLVGFISVKDRIMDVNGNIKEYIDTKIVDDKEQMKKIKLSSFDLNIYDKIEGRYNVYLSQLIEVAEGVELDPCPECGNIMYYVKYFHTKGEDEEQSIRITCTEPTCGVSRMI